MAIDFKRRASLRKISKKKYIEVSVYLPKLILFILLAITMSVFMKSKTAG